MNDRLKKLYNKKVIIYGTGITAEEVIAVFPKDNIIGILDRIKFNGILLNVPILMWEDIEPDSVDVLIIAAAIHNYPIIYWRILDKCITLGIKIYGANGQNLMEYFGGGINRQNICLKANKEELKQKIQHYEVISFDVFDTLIMRKTLEPTDIFDIVQANLKKKGIEIKNFKRYRREAELQSRGGDIYKIYNILKNNLLLDDILLEKILQEEISCEKNFIIPREEMIDIYNYAVQLQKKIYIVSDMYLPSNIIKELLCRVGVNKIDKIFISCEYGKGKGNGLFEVVKSHLQGKSCLHIGDNREADIQSVRKSGIDAYEINSAFDLFQASSFHHVSSFANTINDKILLGLIASKLFQNPFTTIMELENVTFSSLKDVCEILIVPFVLAWVQKLKENLDNNNYEGILFIARDGYFFKNLYDILPEKIIKKIPSYYIYGSRKLAIRTGMDSDDEIVHVLNDFHIERNDKKRFEEVFGIQISEKSEDYFRTEKEQIKSFSKDICTYYKNYLIENGIDLSKKYLLFDLNGRGTSHYFLKKLFDNTLSAFYLFKYYGNQTYDLLSDAVYKFNISNCEYSSLNIGYFFLEILFSAPHSSIQSINKDGKPIYDEEVRSKEIIRLMKTLQEHLLLYLQEYFSKYYIEEIEVTKEVAEHIYDNFMSANYKKECEILNKLKLYDELSGIYLSIL